VSGSEFMDLPSGWRFYYTLHPKITVVLSTICPNGRVNLMPASWNTPVSEEPPTVAVAVDKESYTHECLSHRPEAVINVPSAEYADLVYSLGSVSGRDVDKVSKFGIRLVESKTVNPPGWADALALLEGRVYKSIDVGEVRLYVFEVLRVAVRRGVYTKWGYDFKETSVLLHGAGRSFYTVGRFIRAKRVER